IWTLLLTPIALGLIVLTAEGLGAILKHHMQFCWMQLWYWKDSKGPIGKWERWVLHIREIQLLRNIALNIQGTEDGQITLKFYTTDAPFNVCSTRSFPVRALLNQGDAANNSFEGDTVSISIASWRAMVVVDVTFQQQFGAQAERVASAMWDPWVEKVLEKSLVNWPICNPTNKQSLQWDPQKLLEADGVPKPHTYS
ncbi:unnamed protein product, partial [Polarella glacialis]